MSAPWDGATEWVALRVVTSRSSGHVELQSVTEGRMPVEELASTANVPEVWLQLERKAGVLHARWRAVETQAWVEMAGSPIADRVVLRYSALHSQTELTISSFAYGSTVLCFW